MQTPDTQNRGVPVPCLFTPAEVEAGDAERIARLEPARQPSLMDILRAAARLASLAPPEPPARPAGGPTLSVLLGAPVRPANDIERDRMRARPLDVSATAASLSAGLVRVLILGLEDRGSGVRMWHLAGITERDVAWCRRMTRELRAWGLAEYSVPEGARDELDAVLRITVRGRQVARHIVATGMIARHD
ncbi:hypothetical protein [Methylorubrum extorquens]|uniref:Uncharacterized protein n=1 Tax=Methylorubrum extorquens TaxID=408 RepID=A0AAX3WBU4_METEX|nr:hypothetical protein [Methylorubrum extorquens]WHQ68648.1 hypothetical protein KEC54_20095 [Methylorubrum extorquens]